MSSDPSDLDMPFKDWLAAQATSRDYDVSDNGGGKSKLARDAKVSPAQIGRALTGQAMPSPETLRALAEPLGVPVIEMFLRAKILTVDDIMNLLKSWRPKGDLLDLSSYTAVPPAPQIHEAAEAWGISDNDVPALRAVVERLQERRAAIEALDARVESIRHRFDELAQRFPMADLESDRADLADLLMDMGRLSEDFRLRGAAPTVDFGETAAE